MLLSEVSISYELHIHYYLYKYFLNTLCCLGLTLTVNKQNIMELLSAMLTLLKHHYIPFIFFCQVIHESLFFTRRPKVDTYFNYSAYFDSNKAIFKKDSQQMKE